MIILNTRVFKLCDGPFVIFSNLAAYTADVVIVNESRRQVFVFSDHGVEEVFLAKVTKRQP